MNNFTLRLYERLPVKNLLQAHISQANAILNSDTYNTAYDSEDIHLFAENGKQIADACSILYEEMLKVDSIFFQCKRPQMFGSEGLNFLACPECQTIVGEDDVFCRKCGQRLIKAASKGCECDDA